MDKKEAETVAAFLREYLKRGDKAVTVVMTRDIILSLYTLAEKIANGTCFNADLR